MTTAAVIAVTPRAEAAERPLLLVGLMLTTGQALAWDGEHEEYVLLRPGSRYRGYTVRRLLIDRLIVTREGQLLELPLGPAPLIQRGSRRPERRGTPAGILITATPVPITEPPGAPIATRPGAGAPGRPEAPASQPTSRPASLPTARQAAATPPRPTTTSKVAASQPAAPARAPSRSPSARPAGRKLSLSALRREVSRLVRGRAPYRLSLPRSGGVLLENVRASSLLGSLGLRNGDLLISVGGTPLRSREKAINYYLSLRPGHALDVVVLRNGERRRLAVRVVS